MTTGLQEPFMAMKKGGAVLLETGSQIQPGRAKLVWALQPSHLRKLAR